MLKKSKICVVPGKDTKEREYVDPLAGHKFTELDASERAREFKESGIEKELAERTSGVQAASEVGPDLMNRVMKSGA